jgi:cob(I)alamin adenosyltransferase
MARARDEPVRLTRIYTRGGDAGETSLGDGSRVSKLDRRIVAFGTVDELNATLGVALTVELDASIRAALERVQNELFDLGADLSVPAEIEGRLRIEQAAVDALEADCDRFNADLPELRSFVLPGGSQAAAMLHVADAPSGSRSPRRRSTRSTRSSSSTSTGFPTSSSSSHARRTRATT